MELPAGQQAQATSSFLRYGDFIGLSNDSCGIMGIASAEDEPIPDRSSLVSHCQIIPVDSDDTAFPSEYCVRCMFRLIGEKSPDSRTGEVTFGSIVRLSHEPTGYLLVSHLESIEDAETTTAVVNKKSGRKSCVFLRAKVTSEEETASQWIIHSRFQLRRDGDPIRIEDQIVLKSVAYKDFYLAIADHRSTGIPQESPNKTSRIGGSFWSKGKQQERSLRRQNTAGTNKDMAGKVAAAVSFLGVKTYIGLSPEMSSCGWRLKRFQSGISGESSTAAAAGTADSGRQAIRGGKYIRISHIETKGKLICRVDDDTELQSRLAPIGSVCRKVFSNKSNTHCIFFRRPPSSMAALNPANDHHRGGTNDYLSIWQILPADRMEQNDILQDIKNGDTVRLRHAISGQFLCMRSPRDVDSLIIHTQSNLAILCDRDDNEEDGVEGENEDVEGGEEDGCEGGRRRKRASPNMSKSKSRSFGGDDIPKWKGVGEAGAGSPGGATCRDDDDGEETSSFSVATTDVADHSTVFVIRSYDEGTGRTEGPPGPGGLAPPGTTSSSFLAYQEPLYFEHADSGCQLQLNSLSQTDTESSWCEYRDDAPVRPELAPDEVSQFNACRVEYVRPEEVSEALYSIRFIPLLRIATNALQSEPSAMRLSVFDHLAGGLRVLEQWIRTHVDDDASLPVVADDESSFSSSYANNNSSYYRGLASRRSSHGSDGGSGGDHDRSIRMQRSVSESPEFLHLHGNPLLPLKEKKHNSSDNNRRSSVESQESVASNKSNNREGGGGRSRSGTISEMATDFFRASSQRFTGKKSRSLRKSTTTIFARTKRAKRMSILDQRAYRVDDSLDAAGMLKFHRRQGALADCKLLEMMLHFANIVFTMVRAQDMRAADGRQQQHQQQQYTAGYYNQDEELSSYSYTGGSVMGDRFSVAPVMIECCHLIYQVLGVSVAHKNHRNALRLASIHGLLTTLILHGELDWRPPVEAVLIAAKAVAPRVGAEVREGGGGGGGGVINEDDHLSSEKRSSDSGGSTGPSFGFKGKGVTGLTDVDTLIKHACELQQRGDVSSSAILRLLASICAPGEVPDRFLQDIIVDAIFGSDHVLSSTIPSYIEPGGDAHETSSLPPYGSACNCLFATSLSECDTWMVSVTANDVKVTGEVDKGTHEELIERAAFHTTVPDAAGQSSSGSGEGGSQQPSPEVPVAVSPSTIADILTDLGYGGAILVDEKDSLSGCSVAELERWWGSHCREFYFLGKEYVPKKDTVTVGEDDTGVGNSQEGARSGSCIQGQRDGDSHIAWMENPLANNDTLVGAAQHLGMESRGCRNLLRTRSAAQEQGDDEDRGDEKDDHHYHDNLEVGSPVSYDDHDDDKNMTLLGLQHLDKKPPRTTTKRNRNRVAVDSIEEDDTLDTMDDDQNNRLASYGEDSFGDDGNKLLGATGPKPGVWEEWALALSSTSGRNFIWFQSCLLLMNELCCGGNIRAQRHVSRFLPPELLLTLLQPSSMLDQVGKWLVCRLLRNCYVYHDLVFSLKLETSGPSVCIGLDEQQLNTPGLLTMMGIGKVFNGSTRPHFKECIPGITLRSRLWRFVKTDLPALKLYHSRLSEECGMLLNVTLLRLTRELLVRGFFEDSRVFQVLIADAERSEAERTARFGSHRFHIHVPSPHQWFTGGDASGTGFDHPIIQKTVLAKLEEVLHDHHNDKSQLKDSALLLLSNEELARVIKRVKALGSSDVGVEHIVLVAKHFDSVFTNELYAASVTEAVTLLSDLLNIAQRSMIGCIATFIGTSVQDFVRSNTLLSQDGAMFQISDKLEKKLQTFVSQYGLVGSRSKDPLEGLRINDEAAITRTLLFCTLHSDDGLKSAIYRLLYRRASVQNDLGRLLASSVTLKPTALEATVSRLIDSFGQLLVRYAKELVEYRDARRNVSKESNSMSLISFIMANIESILTNRSLTKGPDESDIDEKSGGGSDHHHFTMLPKLSEVSTRLGKSFRSFTNKGSRDHQAPSILTKLEQREVPVDTRLSTVEWCHLQLDNCMQKRTVMDGAVYISALADALITIINLVCTSEVSSAASTATATTAADEGMRMRFAGSKKGGSSSSSTATVISWFKLLPREKFLVDRAMAFLAAVGSGSPQFATEWYPKVSRLVVKYWHLCNGAALLLEYLCLHCFSFEDFAPVEITSYVVAGLSNPSRDPASGNVAMAARIASAVMLRTGPSELKRSVINGLHGLDIDICKAFITPLFFQTLFEDEDRSKLSNDEAMLSGKLHILQLVSVYAGTLSPRVASSFCGPYFPLYLCEELLGSPQTPFLVKSCILRISAILYDPSQLAYSEHILLDLARVAEVCHHAVEAEEMAAGDLSSHLPSCVEYIFEGAAGALRTLFESLIRSSGPAGDDATGSIVALARSQHESRAARRRRSIAVKMRSRIIKFSPRGARGQQRSDWSEGDRTSNNEGQQYADGEEGGGEVDEGEEEGGRERGRSLSDASYWPQLVDDGSANEGEARMRSATISDASDWHELVDDDDDDEELGGGGGGVFLSASEVDDADGIKSHKPFFRFGNKKEVAMNRARSVTFVDEHASDAAVEMTEVKLRDAAMLGGGKEEEEQEEESKPLVLGDRVLDLIECVVSLCHLVLSNDHLLLYIHGYSRGSEDVAGEPCLSNFTRLLTVCILADRVLNTATDSDWDGGVDITEKVQGYLGKRIPLGKRLKYVLRAMFEWEEKALAEVKHRKVLRSSCEVAISNTVVKSLGLYLPHSGSAPTATSATAAEDADASGNAGPGPTPGVRPGLRREITSKSIKDLASFTPSLVRTDYNAFANDLDVHPAMSYEAMKETALFKVACELVSSAAVYFENGGPKLIDLNGSIRNASLSRGSREQLNPVLAQMTDFDLWLHNGGRYLATIVRHLANYGMVSGGGGGGKGVSADVEVEVNMMLFHLLTLLLENNIEEIRANVTNVRTRMARVSVEIDRMQRNQGVLHACGVMHLVARSLGGTFMLSRSEYRSATAIPVILKLGGALFSRNETIQGEIMSVCQAAIAAAGKSSITPPEALTFSVIRKLFRLCANEVEAGKKGRSIAPIEDILPLIIQLFNFCAALCGGHNATARDFLHNPRGEVARATTQSSQSIVKEASALVNVLLTTVTSMIHYIENEQFNDVFGPLAWDEVPRPQRRRYIAWHNKRNNFHRLAKLVHVASAGFVCLTEMCQGPNLENQKLVVQAAAKCPALLEFFGALQLESQSYVRGSRLAGNFNGFKRLTWLGGYPASFYRTLARELSQYLPEDDPELLVYLAAAHAWRPNTKQYAISREYTEEPGVGSSTTLIGIRLALLKLVCQTAEIKCLRMLLSTLESTQTYIALKIDQHVEEDIFMQNMHNTYRNSLTAWDKQRDFTRATAVSYLTLISTLQSTRAVASGEEMLLASEGSSLLKLWVKQCEKEGLDTSSLVASVEIIGADGKVQCVYFPVPAFVSMYWPYPEVQKAKEASLYSVCRDSPEEKVADFFVKVEGIISVMRRQEVLSYLLTPLVHALFGGKTLSMRLSVFIPPQRLVVLILTFFLNVYYCYESVYGYDESPSWPTHDDTASSMYISNSSSAISYSNSSTNSTSSLSSSSYYTLFPTFIAPFWFWDERQLLVLIGRYVHFGLTFSLALRSMMNSRVLDDSVDLIPREMFFDKGTVSYRFFSLLVDVIQIPRNISLLLFDSLFFIIFLGCSIAGLFFDRYWFYALCLVDVVFQVRYMSFLVTAIQRNVLRISFTIMLAALFLYLFSVGTFLFFNSQYTLNGHMNCNDVGACWKTHLDYGFNNPPDWDSLGFIQPEIMGLDQSTQLGVFISRVTGTIWTLVYTILINLVLQAIVSGLIIDTFSQMREKSEDVEADIKGYCFICSIDRDDFEQAGLSFKHHITHEHNMWKYLWFKLYLEAKDPLTFSGPEHYAFSHINDKNSFVRLLPIKKSLSLDRKRRSLFPEGIPVAVAERVHGVSRGDDDD